MKRGPRPKFNLSVPDILERRQRGETYQQIAVALGCHHVTVFSALKRVIPDHIERLRKRPKHIDYWLAEILEGRARKETLEEIGDRLGVSRERIRQIIANADIDDEARAEVTGWVRPRKHANDPPRIKGHFSSIVNRWLAEIGWRYCSQGKHAQPIIEFSAKNRLCRTCNRERANRRYHEKHELSLERARRYRSEHVEAIRRASAKYYKSNRDQILERQRERMADPVEHEKRKAYWREYARKRASANIRPADTGGGAS
jgi:Sigma-70, region 4